MSVLIEGQQIANAFLALLPTRAHQGKATDIDISARTGPVNLISVPFDVQAKLPEILSPATLGKTPSRRLFNGDISTYNADHSAADLALVAYMARQGLSPDDADLVFRASELYRPKWDEKRGATTYGQRTIARAFDGLQVRPEAATTGESGNTWWDTSNLGRFRPTYVPGGMPARKFIGPIVGPGVRLFPAASLSTLVALGAVGKTSLLMSIGAHVAAGKDWNGHRVEQQKVAIFFCEETEEELTRKISAIIDGWSPAEQVSVMDNLLLVSLLGEDARLTVVERGQYQGSGVAEKIIGLLNTFGLKQGLVVIDHMQGFASGDLNISETATSICREANKIVDATGAAVVFAAHISKANIKATELEQGFAVGSLAFENATRQLAGMLPMSEEAAKKYGLELHRHDYAWLGLPKNSYGGTDAGVWLKKEIVPKYHTVVMTPVQLAVPTSGAVKSTNEKLAERIIDHLLRQPWTTRNQLDGDAGKDGVFKASKEKIRDVLRGLLDTGAIERHSVTDAERLEHDISKQVKEVLKVKPAAEPAKPEDKKNAPAGLKPLLGVA